MIATPQETPVALGAPPSARATVGYRINVPLNVQSWAHLKPAARDSIIWFHQYCIDHGLSWGGAIEALGFGSDDEAAGPALVDIFKGTFQGDIPPMVRRIDDFQRIITERIGLQLATFSENPVTAMIWSGFDYSLAGRHIALVEGDSGHGKTMATNAWIAKKANGRAVRFEVPALGGTSLFVTEIAKSIGYTRANFSLPIMRDAIFRAFNPNRMLLADEGTRLLPKGKALSPDKLEFLREIHDKTGAPLGIVATRRLSDEMENSHYIFEQVLGRCMVIRLPLILTEEVWRPIVVQFFPRPSKALLEAADQVANKKMPPFKGRLRDLGELLKLASRIASNERKTLTEVHLFKAIAVKKQMMLGVAPAA